MTTTIAPFTINLNSLRSGDDDFIYLMLTAQSGYVGELELGKSLSLADFKKQFPTMAFTISQIDSGRLYVGYDPFPAAPVPNGSQYYGWIELTRKSSDTCVWINLSSVDCAGLPLALAGTGMDGAHWSLGYRQPMTVLVQNLKQNALKGPSPDKAVVQCSTRKPHYAPTKIVAPDCCAESYRDYGPTIAALRTANAKLVITSDTPEGAAAKIFTGSFVAMPSGTPPGHEPPGNSAISLVSGEGDTFKVEIGQLSSAIVYHCDGGTLIYNGKTVPQNQTVTPPVTLSPDQVYANSVFRNLMIGLNEGYFSCTETNYSSNFPYLSPFVAEPGNQYAQVIHQNSNSYGFPYADSNLKVLIQADPAKALMLSILEDDKAYGYDAHPGGGGNQPLSGAYQFGIGAGSQALGNITIGNCVYLPTEQGAYGGFLPTLAEWTPMHFSGPDRHIWFRTTGPGYLSGTDCFDCNGQPYTGDISFNAQKVAVWPADISWNPSKASPAQPAEPDPSGGGSGGNGGHGGKSGNGGATSPYDELFVLEYFNGFER